MKKALIMLLKAVYGTLITDAKHRYDRIDEKNTMNETEVTH